MPAEKIKLLPCIFCGGKAFYIFDDKMNWYKGVACKKCSMNIYFFENRRNVACVGYAGSEIEKREIATRWNRRPKIKEAAATSRQVRNNQQGFIVKPLHRKV